MNPVTHFTLQSQRKHKKDKLSESRVIYHNCCPTLGVIHSFYFQRFGGNLPLYTYSKWSKPSYPVISDRVPAFQRCNQPSDLLMIDVHKIPSMNGHLSDEQERPKGVPLP